MVRMGACRVPDRGSIPRRGDFFWPLTDCSGTISTLNEGIRYRWYIFRLFLRHRKTIDQAVLEHAAELPFFYFFWLIYVILLSFIKFWSYEFLSSDLEPVVDSECILEYFPPTLYSPPQTWYPCLMWSLIGLFRPIGIRSTLTGGTTFTSIFSGKTA